MYQNNEDMKLKDIWALMADQPISASQTPPHTSKESLHSFLLPSSPESPEPKSPKLLTVNHRSCFFSSRLYLVLFIDNGEDRTDAVYAKCGIEFKDGSLSPPSLPKLQVTPMIESNHITLSDLESEEHPELNQKALWIAMYVFSTVFITRDSGEDIFTESFKSILSSITPATLTHFDSSTILLLLEICNSYLTKNGEQTVLGISILDSIISFVLNTNNHSDDGRLFYRLSL